MTDGGTLSLSLRQKDFQVNILQIGVNHFGHFLLTKLLLPLLKKATSVPGNRGARIVTVSSAAHIWVGGGGGLARWGVVV